jgi:hypothetical protein
VIGTTTLRRFAACALALGLGAAAVLLDATREGVYLVGHRLDFVCGMKQLFGIPCPACGLTRGVVLTLHGRLADALAVNPAGPLVALGVAALAAWLALGASRGAATTAPSRVLTSYSAFTLAVLVAHWLVVLAG